MDHSLLIDLHEDSPDGVGEGVVVACAVVEVGGVRLATVQVAEYKGGPLIGVVEERPDLAAEALNDLLRGFCILLHSSNLFVIICELKS